MTSESDENNWEWPNEQAEKVKLFLPKDCDPYPEKSQSEQPTCVFRFDRDRRVLVVACDGDTEENIIDIIDPKDIVGVNVEIKMLDPGSVASCSSDDEGDLLSQIHEQDRTSQTAENEPTSATPIDSQGVAVLSIYVYPKGKIIGTKESMLRFCRAERNHSRVTDRRRENIDAMISKDCGQRHARHRRFTVAPVEDFTDLSIMVNAIRELSRSNSSSGRGVITHDEERILVIVNPCSGKKMGVHIYDTTLRPMLEQAGIAHDVLITTHAKHAEERMEKQSSTSDFRDISTYTGMVLVGGDGIVHEVLQGIHRRGDRDGILKRVKLGTIGAGTSNGFSASLAYASKVGVHI
jgi:sphingosine kinase